MSEQVEKKMKKKVFRNYAGKALRDTREYQMTVEDIVKLSDDEHYAVCIELASSNTKHAVLKLYEIYEAAVSNHQRKSARKGLRLVPNRKLVIGVLHTKINEATDDETKLELLRAGVYIYRQRFLKDYLELNHKLHNMIPFEVIREIDGFVDKTDEDYNIIIEYILDNDDYARPLYKMLPKQFKQQLGQSLVGKVEDGLEINRHILYLLYNSHADLDSIADTLRQSLDNWDLGPGYDYIFNGLKFRLSKMNK